MVAPVAYLEGSASILAVDLPALPSPPPPPRAGSPSPERLRKHESLYPKPSSAGPTDLAIAESAMSRQMERHSQTRGHPTQATTSVSATFATTKKKGKPHPDNALLQGAIALHRGAQAPATGARPAGARPAGACPASFALSVSGEAKGVAGISAAYPVSGIKPPPGLEPPHDDWDCGPAFGRDVWDCGARGLS